jgi:C4-dicarboxylate-specific signal transduction histidine kinase
VRAVPSDRDRVLCLVRDMTEQKRAQHHARELQDELAHVGRVMALGTLTGSLAHEINQPLAAITTNAHTALVMLEAAQPDIAEVCAALNDIKSDSHRIDDVLRHLRSMLKKERREYDPVDVNSLVTEVLALVHSDVVRRQISLDVTLAPNLDRVFGDRIQLQQVVLNLLMNACEAVRAVDDGRRHVRLTTAAEHGRVVVSVSDRGIGFQDDQIDRMFEPFFTTTTEGMGLGLSICRAIIDAHGGLISAKPNPDHGLTCWFSLAALAPVEEARVKQPSPSMRSETWN